MQWEAGPHAGFSDVELWLPISADYAMRNVAQQSAEPRSPLSLYRRLLWYRKQQPALYGGSYRPIDVTAPDCFVFARAAPAARVIISLNFAAEERRVMLAGGEQSTIVLSTYLDREERFASTSLALRP